MIIATTLRVGDLIFGISILLPWCKNNLKEEPSHLPTIKIPYYPIASFMKVLESVVISDC